jgi:hypothetical protein
MTKVLLTFLFLSLALLETGRAAIVSVLNSTALESTTIASSYTINSFNPGAGSSKLIVALAAEGNGGSRTISSITFGGVPLTVAIDALSAGTADHHATIYYLDNPNPVAGNIVVTWSGDSNGIGMGVLSVSGTAPGVAATNSSTTNSVNITTTQPDMFLVAAFVDNDPGTLTVNTPLIEMFGGDNIGSAAGAAGYRNVDLPGLVTASGTGGNTVREAAGVAVFAAIPEPSGLVLALIALGGLVVFHSKRLL